MRARICTPCSALLKPPALRLLLQGEQPEGSDSGGGNSNRRGNTNRGRGSRRMVR